MSTLEDLKKVLKGGVGSGNFGHSGRPGKKGGSSSSSGLGAPAVDYQGELDKLKKEMKYDGEVVFSDKSRIFEVDGEQYWASAQYDPATKVITVYNEGFGIDNKPNKGTLAHEVQHARFNGLIDNYNDMLEAREAKGYIPGRELNTTYAKGDYLSSVVNTKRQQAVSAGGVSAYSDSYWKQYNSNPTGTNLVRAVDETLAETAKLKYTGQQVPQFWGKVLEDIEAL